MNLKKYAFIASDYLPLPGGIARYVDTLAKGLRELGNEVFILSVVEEDELKRIEYFKKSEEWIFPIVIPKVKKPRNRIENLLENFLLFAGSIYCLNNIILNKLGMMHPSYVLAKKVKEYMIMNKPDIVVFTNIRPLFICTASLLTELKIPYGIIAYGDEVYKPLKAKSTIPILSKIISRAKWIGAISKYTKSLIRMWNYPESKIVLVPPALSENIFKLSLKDIKIKKENKETFLMFSLSRLVYNKGIDLVIKALQKVIDKESKIHYLVAGDGPERGKLENLARELKIDKYISFLGHISEEKKWKLLRQVDLFILPSRNIPENKDLEGFGIVFLEAACFEVPSIGTNVGGIPEAIENHNTGILVSPESPEEIADAMIYLKKNKRIRKEMGQRAWERARNQFSISDVARRFHNSVLNY